jgi:hypothetical protein
MGPSELKKIERWNGLLAAVLILSSVVLFSGSFALGVTVGALLAVINFRGIRFLVEASLRRQGGKRAALQLLLIAKMGILFALVVLAIHFLPISPVGLAVGLSVFLLSIAVESVRSALGMSPADPSSGGNEAHDGRA